MTPWGSGEEAGSSLLLRRREETVTGFGEMRVQGKHIAQALRPHEL